MKNRAREETSILTNIQAHYMVNMEETTKCKVVFTIIFKMLFFLAAIFEQNLFKKKF